MMLEVLLLLTLYAEIYGPFTFLYVSENSYLGENGIILECGIVG